MAISQEQRSLRAGKLGSSDATRIMQGRWHELWLEKTGRTSPSNLDFVPAVQIGIATEALHARFYTHRTGIGCYAAGDRTFVHPSHDFIVAHLDFLTWSEAPTDPGAPADTVLEAKFHAGNKSDQDLAERYYWQIQHQMLVGGYGRAVLSILRPSSYSFLHLDRDDADAAMLLETLRAFWWHVENDVDPIDPLAVPPPDLDRLRVLNMAHHNEFMSLSEVLIENRSGFLSFRSAEVALKALMPDQARIAFLPSPEDGGARQGVLLTRSRDGKLTLKFGDLPRKYLGKAERWLPELTLAGADEHRSDSWETTE